MSGLTSPGSFIVSDCINILHPLPVNTSKTGSSRHNRPASALLPSPPEGCRRSSAKTRLRDESYDAQL